MKEAFVSKRFQSKTIDIIDKAESIIEEYEEQGLDLTLRQLYYQFVSKGWLPNKQSSYEKLGQIISNARLAGVIDWDAIVDRTRVLNKYSTWDSPEDILSSAKQTYREHKWDTQPFYVEVWVEKEALAGVVQHACQMYEVPSFSCRGYVSQSAMWQASRRMKWKIGQGKTPVILHLGDHDPSGLDMTRDIEDRMEMFEVLADMKVRRIALTAEQIEKYAPPPNPAKITDSRFDEYRRLHGQESWELDAMEPNQLIELIQNETENFVHKGAWEKAVARQEENRKRIPTEV